MQSSTEQWNAADAELQAQLANYLAACRARIPGFVHAHYAWPGALRLNRLAWGGDVLVAPFNFFMGFPNFLLHVLAFALERLGARRAARWLLRRHFGLTTRVQSTLRARLMEELLDLPANQGGVTDRLRDLVGLAAREPLALYVQTRNIAADVTAGSLAAVAGLVFLSQFTPGSISAGSAVAHWFAKEQAISEFLLGDLGGRWYYALFPVDPSVSVIAAAMAVVMATIAVVAAFSGIVHDPIQAWTGIHRRRLNQLLDAIEASVRHSPGEGYRPKDTLFGRVYDLVDWIKGLLQF